MSNVRLSKTNHQRNILPGLPSAKAGSGDHQSILLSERCSDALRRRLTECIASYQAYEATGSAAMLYIAAWQEGSKDIWYEYASPKFTALLNCKQHEIAQLFRTSLIDRRTYRNPSDDFTIQRDIRSNNELSHSWRDLREEGKREGSIEAIYKVLTQRGETVWLKDHATIELHRQDNICLSLGFLTVVSREMAAEEILQQHHDLLESLIQGRTAELTQLNKQLKKEVEERRLIQEELGKSNARLQQSLEEIVQAMSLTLEERDPYTVGHQRRTTALALSIAEKMGVPENTAKGLQMAALIHDMGKISVPGEILSKPGPLNEAELLLIRRHPKVAYDILQQINFPWPVDKIVLQHHERYDGSGYPQGLAADEILLEARILCVADVVETMATHRPYRASLGNDAALREIRENRGILYDPQVVDACLSLFDGNSCQHLTDL